ncbi:hypothetical protein B0H11DRAFT_753797 [Mycena galericulata]|nr:hypothetical protein B0H11DRAFT_753797 [Mycena galericulata]
MRAYTTLTLDDDILDRILTFCSTFASLQASILVSKVFHRVFQSHPKSITCAVAYNVVGPALPQALRVVRYPYYLYDSEGDPTAMAMECPEDRDIGVLTRKKSKNLWRTPESSWSLRISTV